MSWPLLPSFLNRKGRCLVPWLLAWPWFLGEHGLPWWEWWLRVPEPLRVGQRRMLRTALLVHPPLWAENEPGLRGAEFWCRVRWAVCQQTSVSLPFQGGRTGSPSGRGNKGDLTVVFVLVEIWRYVSPKEFSEWYLRNSKHRLPISWLLQKPGPTVLPMNCHLKFPT